MKIFTKIIFALIPVAAVMLVVWLFFLVEKKEIVTERSEYKGEVFISPSPSPSVLPSVSPEATPAVSSLPAAAAGDEEISLPETMAVTVETSKGNIELELYPTVAPKTVFNFISLAEQGFYDGTKFHRVISDFMIQGGDPLSKTDDPAVGTGGPDYFFEDEINPKSLGLSDETIKQLEAMGYEYNYDLQSLPNKVGALAMANAGPNTNGSQFFIIIRQDQPHLNGKHTVFGKVIGGMDIVRTIEQGDVINKITISNF